MRTSTKADRTVSALCLCGAAVLAGCTGAEKAASDSAAVVATSPIPAVPVQAVTLTASDVEHFIAAARDLQRIGVRAQGNMRGGPQGLQLSAEALGVLRQHTFDVPRYQQVAYSVMLAYAAEDVAKAAKGNDMAAKLEEMKSKLPPEQYEAMKKMTEVANAQVQAMAQQPQGNIELVARYRDQIKALSEAK